jgi:hypothetical protein
MCTKTSISSTQGNQKRETKTKTKTLKHLVGNNRSQKLHSSHNFANIPATKQRLSSQCAHHELNPIHGFCGLLKQRRSVQHSSVLVPQQVEWNCTLSSSSQISFLQPTSHHDRKTSNIKIFVTISRK